MSVKVTRRHRRLLVILSATLSLPVIASAQSGHTEHGQHRKRDGDQVVAAADASMGGHDHGDMNSRFHMEMTPTRPATREDSVRAERLVDELRQSITKYRDTAVAVADGYRMFMPKVKTQRIYHFTNRRRAVAEAFRFDATRPTSLLYRRAPDGRLELYGAMYTAPKRVSADRLDERIPLSIARWHKHVNWCVPKLAQRERWLERRDGHPVFGPQSPIATRDACDAVGGRFFPSPLGWMVHVNVFARDPKAVWEH